MLKRLRAEGLALLYISHRMHEIAELADECTVFRNGRNVATYRGRHEDRQRGRRDDDRPRIQPRLSAEAAAARATSDAAARGARPRLGRPAERHLAACCAPGEVVGLGGLDGQGQRELLLALFGVLRGVSGEILIDGKPVAHRRARARRSRKAIGMALIPEDRKTEGLMLPMSVRDNLSFAALDRLSRGGVIDRAAESEAVDEMIELLAIRTDGTDVPVGSLSGGNQQKVVIAKWLMIEPRIILLNDPTRGIDVGTKQEIYQLLRKLADAGAAILFYSTDYDELIGCCDRVLVLYDGAIKRELVGAEITERALVGSALNIADERDGRRRDGGVSAMSDWRYRLRRAPRHAARVRDLRRDVRDLRRATIRAGFTANVVQTAANKGVLLALVAMAQTLGGAHRRHRPFGRHGVHPRPIASPRAIVVGDAADGGARRRSACCWPASPAARSTA